MPTQPGEGIFRVISILMFIVKIAKELLIVFILFRGICLINLNIKKNKANNPVEKRKMFKKSEKLEKPEESEEPEEPKDNIEE